MACSPILGRLKTAGIFRLDNCMKPIYDPEGGYIDDCFAAFSTSDNMDEGESFTRRCADGTILYTDAGEQSLESVEVNLDLNGEPDIEWLAAVGLVTPIYTATGPDAPVNGYTRCTKSSANLLIAIWQEVLGDTCDEEAAGGWRLHLFPLKKARLTFEGDIGAEDGFIRITGVTSATANLEKGPIPFLAGVPAPLYPTVDLEVCHHTVLTNQVAPPPDECGVIPTEEPDPGEG